MPRNILNFFRRNKKSPTYNRLYDAKALEVIAIESAKKEFSASASVADGKTPSVAKGTPNSTIRIADLLELVNGDAKKYIPQNLTSASVNTNSAQSAEPDMYQNVQQLLASGQGKDVGQTVDTETQAEYDNENDVLDALDSMPKRTAGIEYNSGNAIRLSKREYAAVTSRISTNYHNANTEHEGIQFIDRSTDGNDAKMYMYLYRDYGFGSYEIIGRIDYAQHSDLIH